MPSGAKVGDAWVSVQPETQGFYHELERQLKDRFKKDKPKVPFEAELDRDQVQREADEKLKGKPVKVRVEPDLDGAKFREEIKREFKARPITVNTQLSKPDVARMSAQLENLTRDRRATVHIDVKDDGLARVLSVLENLNNKDLSKGAVRAKLVLDTEEMDTQLDNWQRRVGVVKLDFDDTQARGKLAELEDVLNEMLGDTYMVDVEVNKKQVAEVQRQLNRLSRDEEKKITVRYVQSRAAGQKAIRDELERLSADREMTVTLRPDTEQLDMEMDAGRQVSVRPYMIAGAAKKLEEQLDKLTRPRMVEILTGEMNFSGFTEDLGQALQTAWEDMDPRLSMADVFGDEALRVATDTDAVYKVFVTNQPKGWDDDSPLRVDVADVSTDKPLTVADDPTTAARPKPVDVADSTTAQPVRVKQVPDPDAAGRTKLDMDRIAAEIRRGQTARFGVDPDGALKSRLAALNVQLKRFTDRAAATAGRNTNLADYQTWVQGALNDLTAKYRQWAPANDKHLRTILETNDLGGGLTLGKLRAGHNNIARAGSTMSHNNAMAANDMLHVGFLSREIERLSTQLGKRTTAPDLGEVYARRVPAMEEELESLGARLRETRAALEKNTSALSMEERTLREFNLRRLVADPGAEHMSLRQFRQMRRAQRARVPIDWDVVDGDGPLSQAAESAFGGHGGGTFTRFVRRVAHGLAMPVARVADLGVQTGKAVGSATIRNAGDISLATGGRVLDGVNAAGISLDLPAGAAPSSKRGTAAAATRLAGRVAGPAGVVAGALGKGYMAAASLGGVAAVAGGAGEAIAGSFGMASAALGPFVQSLKAVSFAPALLTTLASAAGATTVAWSGLGEAFADTEDGQKALANLTENARAFVVTSKGLAPQLKEIKSVTQDGFFEGWDDSMRRIGEVTLPVLAKSLPKVAAGFGGLGREFINSLGSEQGAQNVERTLNATADGFTRMQPGMRSMMDFFTRAAAVGAEELLPRLGDGFSNLMGKMDQWGSEGKLQEWMDSAVDGLSKVGDFASTAWTGLSGFFKGASDGANRAFGDGGVWGAMMDKLDRFSEWSNSEAGSNALSNFFEGATESAKKVGDILGDWGGKFVTETMPAARGFLDEHGESIKQIGSDLISAMTDMMGAAGPIIESLKPVVSGIAKAAEIANELAGGTGSRKSAEEMGRLAQGTEDIVDQRWKEQSRNASTWDPASNDKAIAAQQDRLREMNDRISAEAAAGNADTAGFKSYVDQMERLAFVTEAMKGGMSGATQSVDATVAALSLLGDKIVDIPDEKSIVVKADQADQSVQALERVGAKVEELEDGKLKINFENEMDVELAIQKIRQQISDMPEAEIRARGLDTVLAQLEGMQGDKTVTLNVQGNAEDVVRQLDELGAKASAGINGSVNIDLNDGGTRQWLVDIGAASHIDGTFTMKSNAQEIIAEVLSLNGTETNGQHTIGDNADSVRAAIDGIPKATSGTHTISSNVGAITASVWALNGTHTLSTHEVRTVRTQVNAVSGMAAQMQIPGMRGATGGFFTGDTFARLPRHAAGAKHKGYQLPATGPGTEKVDGFLALDNTLTPTAWLNRNEWVINEEQSLRNDALLASINAGRFPQLSDEQVRMLENLPAFAEGGSARAKRLREENRARAKAEADAKSKKKPATPASQGQIAAYDAAVARGEEIDRLRQDGFARKLVAIRNGQFVYADVDPKEDGAIQAVDREGLIDERVAIRQYLNRSKNVSPRSRYLLGTMEGAGRELTPEEKAALDKLPPQVRDEILRRRDIPAHVKQAIINGERLETEDGRIDWDQVIQSPDWAQAFQTISADPWNKANQDKAAYLVHDELQAVGKTVGQTYLDEAAGMFGFNFSKLRDIPLYNTLNPSNEAWNELIGDVSGARRELEGDYRDSYQADRDAYREAEQREREAQKAADEAKRREELFGDSDRLAKAIASQDEKNNDELARHKAGMAAVARARQTRGASAGGRAAGGGVVVNQTIGNITAASTQDAADKFRRQAIVGFENLAGAWK